MLIVTLIIVVLFAWILSMAAAEPPSPDSGSNLAVTSIMMMIVLILISFITLTVTLNHQHLQVKFGYGIYQKKFAINEILSVKAVKNRWYYGRGIRRRPWPKMRIYNVSGFDAIEIKLRNGKVYRIGTDQPKQLEQAILQSLS